MALISRSNVETLLEQGRVGLDNAKITTEILDLLTPLGYGDSKLMEGILIRDNLQVKYEDQLRLYAQQKEATNQLEDVQNAAKQSYDRHSGIAKALLKQNPELLARLGLEGAQPQKLNLWMEHAKKFYRECLADADIMAQLATGGLDQTTLEDGQIAIQSVGDADNAQESAKGLAQQSTQDRNDAYQVFKTWMDHFWKIVDVALADTPQWMERLGRVVKS